MASRSPTPVVSSREGYRSGAQRYDTEANPILSLERRFLEPLLPPVSGLDVIDLGCGTGRWLEILKATAPRSLLGIDSSREMLWQAKRKLKNAARLLRADGATVSLAPTSADLVLCNIMLSYVENPGALLSNARIALRQNGALFFTDVHPETSAALQWRRGIPAKAGFQEIRTIPRSVDSVIAFCEGVGLQLCARLEPCFGEAEREIFAAAGKSKYFEQALGHPAIYILQFRPLPKMHSRITQNRTDVAIDSIHNARIAIGPQECIRGSLTISNARIETLGSEPDHDFCTNRANSTVDLNGYLLLPGLVNAHDHLEFALFPRLGNGNYRNCNDWAEDIHRAETAVIAKHRQIPKDVRLWWGGIRNLTCGATTVSHHNPYVPHVFEEDFVVRVVRDYGWAHSLSMDASAAEKKRQTSSGQPFLIHLAEGIDEQTENEACELHNAGALDKETVVIHGLALNKKGLQLLRASGAGLIWCPSSNVFLFGRTLAPCDILFLSQVAVGSDSSLTAEGDLLDEVRFAHGVSQLPVELLYDFTTRRAAQLLRLQEGQGTLRVGGLADLVAVRDKAQSPAATLASLSHRDVQLVVIGGRVHLASDEMLQRLPSNMHKDLQPLLLEDTVRWIRAPLDRLFRETAPHQPGGIFLGGKRVSVAIHD
jgi:cytosine/adenosine deaminase-related metal-dependent hydrolase/SAM-dependent methyltransferase